MEKLQQAIKGVTVTVTWAEVGMNYDTNTGFTSLADLQNWAAHFGLQVVRVENVQPEQYRISKIIE